MSDLARTRIELTPAELAQLRAAAATDAPSFVDRLGLPLDVERVEQPWFRHHRILEVATGAGSSARTLTVIAGDRTMRVLTARIDNLRAAAADDPPVGLDSEDGAATYASCGNGWTSAYALGELRIGSVDDIPWQAHLDDDARQRIAEVRARWGAAIGPETRQRDRAGWHVHGWWIATRQLIERELVVEPSGQLRRIDQVHEEYLPVPPGRYWKLVNGRLVPVG
jgi:hypothetical protein